MVQVIVSSNGFDVSDYWALLALVLVGHDSHGTQHRSHVGGRLSAVLLLMIQGACLLNSFDVD